MQENDSEKNKKNTRNGNWKKHTTTKSTTDSTGEERDLECAEPTKGMLPLSPRRRAGFTGLLDMAI